MNQYNITVTPVYNQLPRVTVTVSCDISHRGPHPFHILGFGGVGGKLLKAQGRRLSRKAGVLKQAATLQTLLPQPLIILVEEMDRLLIGAHALSPQPVCLYGRRDPSKRIHTEDKNKRAGWVHCTVYKQQQTQQQHTNVYNTATMPVFVNAVLLLICVVLTYPFWFSANETVFLKSFCKHVIDSCQC